MPTGSTLILFIFLPCLKLFYLFKILAFLTPWAPHNLFMPGFCHIPKSFRSVHLIAAIRAPEYPYLIVIYLHIDYPACLLVGFESLLEKIRFTSSDLISYLPKSSRRISCPLMKILTAMLFRCLPISFCCW